MLAWGLLQQVRHCGPGDIWDGTVQRQIRKQGIIMRQDHLALNSWDNCSLTIAATMSADSGFVRSAEMPSADVNPLPGKGYSSHLKPPRTAPVKDATPPREASRPWMNFVI